MDRHSSSTPYDVLHSLQGELDNLDKLKVSHERCIYRVPRHLQMANEGAYTPLVVSIGPLHHDDEHLLATQIHKLNYLKSFLDRSHKTGPGLQGYLDIVKLHEFKIRGYYAEPEVAEMPVEKLIKMVLVDAAFLIELFSRGFNRDLIKDDDQMFNPPRMVVKVSHDICLAENQLPFFILYELYDAAKFGQPDVAQSFLSMVCQFLGIKRVPSQSVYKHLLDLLRVDYLPTHTREQRIEIKDGKKRDLAWSVGPLAAGLSVSVTTLCSGFCYCHPAPNMDVVDIERQNDNDDSKKSLPRQPKKEEKKSIPVVGKSKMATATATALREAGVRFATYEKDSKEEPRMLDIKFDPTKRTLWIPKIMVEDDTEALLKNLAVFEQCNYYEDSYIIDYLTFMDLLINTKEDVELLVKEEIIESLLGSDQRVADMFNGLGKQLSLRSENFYYAELCTQLSDYYNQPCNHYLAVLRQKYFSHPWAIISVVYAILLLFLTALQTTTGVIQILPSKK